MKELSDKEVMEIVDSAFDRFSGSEEEIAKAIGVFIIARKIGWKPTFLLHSTATIRKYEKILGITFRDVLPEVGPLARKSVAWKLSEKVSNFWKLVKGQSTEIQRTPDWGKLKK